MVLTKPVFLTLLRSSAALAPGSFVPNGGLGYDIAHWSENGSLVYKIGPARRNQKYVTEDELYRAYERLASGHRPDRAWYNAAFGKRASQNPCNLCILRYAVEQAGVRRC